MDKDRITIATAARISRRSLLTSRASYVLSLLALPQLLYACGSAHSEPAPPPPASSQNKQPSDKKSLAKNRRKAQSADAKINSSTPRSEHADEEDPSDITEDDHRPDLDEDVDAGEVPEVIEPGEQSQGASNLPQSTVRGATPDSGFFSASAPQLTREQILAGQQIRGRCEGGLHELIIEPEHLQALARGEAVTIKSSTHTHIGNPTVHNHSIRYTPLIG